MNKVRAVAVVVAALAGATMATPAQAAGVTPADGEGHSLVVYAKSGKPGFLVCRDWTSSQNTAHTCDSQTANLGPGQNTKDQLGWPDTDGIRVGKNQELIQSVSGPDVAIYTSCGHTTWVKVTPGLISKSKYFYIVNDAPVC